MMQGKLTDCSLSPTESITHSFISVIEELEDESLLKRVFFPPYLSIYLFIYSFAIQLSAQGSSDSRGETHSQY